MENVKPSTLKGSRISLIPITLVVCSIVLAWLFLTPFGSVPDEFSYAHYGVYNTNNILHILPSNPKYHLTGYQVFNIIERPCFAFDPNANGSCQKFPEVKLLANNYPSLSNYPTPWFYLTSWPLLYVNGALGYYSVRFLASILNLGLLAWGILLWRRKKSTLVWTLGFAISPLLIQMICSYNPNGFEISTALALNLLLYGESPTKSKFERTRFSGIIISSLGLSIAKPLSGIYVFLSVVTYIILKTYPKWNLTINSKENQDYKTNKKINGIGLKTLYLFLWALSCIAISLTVSIPSLVAVKKLNKSSSLSSVDLFLQFLHHSASWLLEFAGLFGWRDTRTPPVLAIFWCLFILASIALVFLFSLKRDLILIQLAILILLAFIYPGLVYVQLGHNFNFGYQSRYVGAAFVILPFVVLFEDVNFTHFKKLEIIGIVLLILDFISCCYVSLRYQYGVNNLGTMKFNLVLQAIQEEGWHTPFFSLGMFFIFITIYLLIFLSIQISKLKNIRFRGQVLLSLLLTSCFGVLFVIPSGQVFRPITYYPDILSLPASHPFGEITKGMVLQQSFVSDKNNLSRIDILLATYARSNSTHLRVELLENNTKLIYRKLVSEASLSDNSYFSILFPTIRQSKGHIFQIILSSPDGFSGNTVTAWLTSAKSSMSIGESISNVNTPSYLVFNTYTE